MKKRYILLLLGFIIILVGCSDKDKVNMKETMPRGDTSNKINNINEEVNKSLIELIDEKAIEVLGDYKDNVSIYFKNLRSNDEYYLNENTYYVAASTNKVPLAMMILDEVSNGDKSLDDVLYFSQDDREGGSGILLNLDEVPNITINEAIYLSIVESDNIAKNMLTRVANTSITDYMRYVTGNSEVPYGNYTTAKQMGIILDRLYENPDNNPYYETLISYMTKTSHHDRLDKYLPYDKVAHKIGNYYRYYHDIGIIYGKDPYILVVLTKDIGEVSDEAYDDGGEDERYLLDWGEEDCELIAQLSKEIYTIVEENKI